MEGVTGDSDLSLDSVIGMFVTCPGFLFCRH